MFSLLHVYPQKKIHCDMEDFFILSHILVYKLTRPWYQHQLDRPGKMGKHFPARGKSGNFEYILEKDRESAQNTGNQDMTIHP